MVEIRGVALVSGIDKIYLLSSNFSVGGFSTSHTITLPISTCGHSLESVGFSSVSYLLNIAVYIAQDE